MGIWFTSDWHLSHENIMKYSKRPFNTVEEMNETIMSNYNSLVKESDAVYFLGDFCFNIRRIEEFLKQMKGRIYFILGNHDRRAEEFFRKYGEAVWDMKEIHINKQSITLCHYALMTHPKSHYNAWCLYGHTHGDISDVIQGKKMNVGVDLNDFKPVSFEQVKHYMDKREDNWNLVKPRQR